MQNRNIFYVLGIVGLFLIFYHFFLSAPANFPVPSTFHIEEGSSLRSVSRQLKEAHAIRSRAAFEAVVILFGKSHVIESDYYFEDKLSLLEVADRVTKGKTNMAPIVVTIPEGFTNKDIGEAFALKLVHFDKADFLEKSTDLQGYLFPDTYFFESDAGASAAITAMSDNYDKKMKKVRPLIVTAGKKESEIIIMASLIEGEAKGEDDRAIISGILWHRIKIGMPLQVDIAPETYKMKGLTKKPIGNPGLAAIMAAIYPENSPYFYYLHDKEGKIHYAKTFSEHLKNISKYLK